MDEKRREFLGKAGLLLVSSQTAFGYQANSTVDLGLVGCGSRGNWITPLFQEFTGARLVAVADVVKDKLDATRDKFKVDVGRAYYGPQAYGELASSKLDAVVIETPPYYHPEQAMAAVDAGKHVYLAKPAAVDVPGCKTVEAAGRKARGNVSFLVDFQTRAQPVFQELAQRTHRGDIGKIAFVEALYYAGRPWNGTADPSDPGRMRMSAFYMDKVLGGDIIVEQNIHTLDVVNWLLNGRPVKAFGTGGRTDWKGTKWEFGDALDHFLVRKRCKSAVFVQPTDLFVQRHCGAVLRHQGLRRRALWRVGAHRRRERLEGQRQRRHLPAGRDQQCQGVRRERQDRQASEQYG
jgi:predicted dehydrogenase